MKQNAAIELSGVSLASAGGAHRGWRADVVHANDWHTGLFSPSTAGAEDELRDRGGDRQPSRAAAS
ncbi:MAG: glycogen/starch synthase [Xanthobacteraceae bacterium]